MMKYHVASIAERHNYAECYTQEIINEVRISFAYSRFATTCRLGGQYNIFFFLQEFTLKWNLVPRERIQEIQTTMILAFIKKKAGYM